MSHLDKPPDLTEELIETYLGRYALVGLTFCDSKGKAFKQQQVHGIIEQVGSGGIKIALQGSKKGKSCTLPPDLRSICSAQPGQYTLRSTGEIIENPDFLATWDIYLKNANKAKRKKIIEDPDYLPSWEEP